MPNSDRARAQIYAAFSARDGSLKRKGPFTRLLLEVGVVREGVDGQVIAQHRDHEWHVDGERFTRLDVENHVQVQFLDGTASKTYGPFTGFSSVDGVAFREGEVFAYVDPRRNVWVRQDDGKSWPVLLIEPAS